MTGITRSTVLAAATLALLTSVAHAKLCTNDDAIPWPDTFPGVNDCNGNADCIAAQCAALNIASGVPRDCSQGNSKRQTESLECVGNELCLKYYTTVATTLLCLDPDNGAYHDESGGQGNAISRVYTANDGAVNTFTGTVQPTLKTIITQIQTATIVSTAPGGVATQTVTTVMTVGGGYDIGLAAQMSALAAQAAAAQAAASAGSAGAAAASSAVDVPAAAAAPATATVTVSGAPGVAAQSSAAAATGLFVSGGGGGVAAAAAPQSSTTMAASVRPSMSAMSSGAAQQTGAAVANHKLASGALGLVAGVPLLVAVL